MVDEAGQLFRVVVSGPIVDETRRVAEHWRSLQLEAAEPATAAVAPAAGLAQPASDSDATSVAPATPAAASGAPAAAASRTTAWVDSARCSSCDECVRRSPRMFAYDADKRAVLRDARAGSYRELVEAAEHCKMAVIHPGEPWDANEPDSSELRQRAAVFG
jgi:ferredoxin